MILILFKAISRRIHYGKFVAEVKFSDAPHDYEPAICSKVDKLVVNKMWIYLVFY